MFLVICDLNILEYFQWNQVLLRPEIGMQGLDGVLKIMAAYDAVYREGRRAGIIGAKTENFFKMSFRPFQISFAHKGHGNQRLVVRAS